MSEIVWFKQAKRDLKSAYNSYESGDFYVSALLIQQAVEKSLKFIYFKKNNDLIRIHDLVKLAKLVNAPNNITNYCIKLNPVYIMVRYPDSNILPADKVNKQECELLLKIAEEIIKWVQKKA